MKPYLNDLGGKNRIPIQAFKGIHTGISPLLIDEGQAEDMKNLDTRDYPLLKTRAPRDLVSEVSGNVRYFGTIDDTYLSASVGTKWQYYNGTTWTDLSEVEAADGDGVIFRGKNIYVNGSTGGGYCYEGTTKSRLDQMPDIHYITTNANRLYGVDKTKSYLYFSDYGDSGANNWTGEGSGVMEIITANGEKCSGIVAFNNSVIVFKPHSTHELYGTGPSSYQLVNISGMIGCISHRTIKEVSRNLFWLGDSVYVYNGGSKPNDIGQPIKRYLDNKGDLTKACSGTDGERYYLSLPQSDNSYVLLVYDTRTNVWTAEDNSGFIQFTTFKNELYGITTSGKIYKMISTTSENISWHWKSKYFSSGMPSIKQNFHCVYITLEIGTGATFKAQVINNKGQSADLTQDVKDGVGNGYTKILRIMIPAAMGHNSDWLQIILSGNGYCKIHSIERELRNKRGSY